jgi:hypothetical protein
MRRASPERPKADQAAGSIGDSRDRTASAKGKEKKRNEKKEKRALQKSKAAKEISKQEKKEGAAGLTSNLEKQTALNLLNNWRPKAEDWLMAIERRRGK